MLHYIVDNVQPESTLDEALANAAAVFASAGLMVCGPQLMGFELMERADHQRSAVAALPRYRDEGHFVANQLVERCHLERRHSVYLNLDLDDDTPALSLDVALSQAGAPGTIVVFRNQPPKLGTVAQVAPPPGISLQTVGEDC